MRYNLSTPGIVYMLTTAVTAWVALALQFYITVISAPPEGTTTVNSIIFYFSFFTILTNLIVALSFTIRLLAPSSKAAMFFASPSVATAITVYILVVGLVYNLILRNLWHPAGPQVLADNLLHVVVPVLYLLFWIIFVSKTTLNWHTPFTWLLFPAIYFVYVLARGAITNQYPYPFIDVVKTGYPQMFLNAAVVLVVFLVLGLLLTGIGKMIKQKK